MNTCPPMVSRACASLLGMPTRSADPLTARTRTAVYRTVLGDGRSVIVKLYASTARRNALTEAAAILAAAATVPVPKVLGYGVISCEGATALITSDLGALTLGRAVRSGRVSPAQALKDIGVLLAHLHRAPLARPMASRFFLDAAIVLTNRCPPELLDLIRPCLTLLADSRVPASPVWCHGDVHFDNVVLSGPDETRHLVDFTDAAPGPRESDVAHALVMTASHAPIGRRLLTSAYSPSLNDAHLSAWVVFHTGLCWAYAARNEERDLWAGRLADLKRQTPHLFRTTHTERSPR